MQQQPSQSQTRDRLTDGNSTERHCTKVELDIREVFT